MKVKILLFLILPLLSFAQYGASLVPDWDMETDAVNTWDGWIMRTDVTEITGLDTVFAGAKSLRITGTEAGDAYGGQTITGAFTAETTYRMRVYMQSQSTHIDDKVGYGIFDHSNSAWIQTRIWETRLGWTQVTYKFDTPAGCTSLRLYLVIGNGNTGEGYFDNAGIFKQIDTLYTDSAQADDTDDDSTKTLTEAFEYRGAHTGGTFITVSGTYAESIVMDSSFTKWSASGGNVNVTAVDFNSVTCALDYAIWNGIGTVSNAENVIIYNFPPAHADSLESELLKVGSNLLRL